MSDGLICHCNQNFIIYITKIPSCLLCDPPPFLKKLCSFQTGYDDPTSPPLELPNIMWVGRRVLFLGGIWFSPGSDADQTIQPSIHASIQSTRVKVGPSTTQRNQYTASYRTKCTATRTKYTNRVIAVQCTVKRETRLVRKTIGRQVTQPQDIHNQRFFPPTHPPLPQPWSAFNSLHSNVTYTTTPYTYIISL